MEDWLNQVGIPRQISLDPDEALDVEIVSDEQTEIEPPWRVTILNDDVTTFEFVIRVLQTVFEIDVMTAEQMAWITHTKGSCYVATYGKSEAEKRVGKAKFAAQLEGYPLQFRLDPE